MLTTKSLRHKRLPLGSRRSLSLEPPAGHTTAIHGDRNQPETLSIQHLNSMFTPRGSLCVELRCKSMILGGKRLHVPPCGLKVCVRSTVAHHASTADCIYRLSSTKMQFLATAWLHLNRLHWNVGVAPPSFHNLKIDHTHHPLRGAGIHATSAGANNRGCRTLTYNTAEHPCRPTTATLNLHTILNSRCVRTPLQADMKRLSNRSQGEHPSQRHQATQY